MDKWRLFKGRITIDRGVDGEILNNIMDVWMFEYDGEVDLKIYFMFERIQEYGLSNPRDETMGVPNII